jgi:hypothetical protein
MLIGVIWKPTFWSYFCTKRILSVPGFGDIICKRAPWSKFLYFTDNEKKISYHRPSKLFKIFPVISHLNKKFQELFPSNQDISIDETLKLWKACLSFTQWTASALGIRIFEVCDAATGYLWHFSVYTGKHVKVESPLILLMWTKQLPFFWNWRILYWRKDRLYARIIPATHLSWQKH